MAERTITLISGGAEGDLLILHKHAASPGDVIIQDSAAGGTDSIMADSNFTLTGSSDVIGFNRGPVVWHELFRSNNG